jgi:hypothetical protein
MVLATVEEKRLRDGECEKETPKMQEDYAVLYAGVDGLRSREAIILTKSLCRKCQRVSQRESILPCRDDDDVVVVAVDDEMQPVGEQRRSRFLLVRIGDRPVDMSQSGRGK